MMGVKKTLRKAFCILGPKGFRNLKGLPTSQIIITILYFPIICLMWWGYYMWRKQSNLKEENNGKIK